MILVTKDTFTQPFKKSNTIVCSTLRGSIAPTTIILTFIQYFSNNLENTRIKQRGDLM
jgi:hypothetical protein